MSRVQLALNVASLEEAIDFYSRLFATPPAMVRPDYANFSIVDPPLKLVLIRNGTGQRGTLNHLGVEVESADEVRAAKDRLIDVGLSPVVEDHVTCCYALQDKVWVEGPSGEPWEVYTVLADAAEVRQSVGPHDPTAAVCCLGQATLDGAAPACC